MVLFDSASRRGRRSHLTACFGLGGGAGLGVCGCAGKAGGAAWECRVPSRHNGVSRSTAGRDGTRPSRTAARPAFPEQHPTRQGLWRRLLGVSSSISTRRYQPQHPWRRWSSVIPRTAIYPSCFLGVSSSISTQQCQPNPRWPRWNSAIPGAATFPAKPIRTGCE